MSEANTGEMDYLGLRDRLNEVREQPDWKKQADKECDFYDGNQLDAETLIDLQTLGIPPVIENLISPTIDSVLGFEAKTRTDWTVSAESGDDLDEIANGVSAEMKLAEQESQADRACSDAVASQVKAGLGWVEVRRETDPFKYGYSCRMVHRNEMVWDWLAKEPDLADARWLIRRRWFDSDVVSLCFPKKKELIDASSNGWSEDDPWFLGNDTGLFQSLEIERGASWDDAEWRLLERRRVCLYEVWYRTYHRGKVLKYRDGRAELFDKNDVKHILAADMGEADVLDSIYSRVRLAWWMGPHKLADIPSPYPHNEFPYVPFFGKREDRTGIPYGLIRPMLPMQVEINARNLKLLWLLASKRVVASKGIVLDRERARAEIARPDAWIELEDTKISNPRFEVQTDLQLTEQQYRLLVDKRTSLQNVGGVHNAFQGKSERGITAGVALNSLVEQTTQTLAEVLDNTRFSRRKVGQLLMSLVLEDLGGREKSVALQSEFMAEQGKVVTLNKRDPSGKITNNVSQARLKLALSDVPSTSSYRMQQLQLLSEITKSLPPEVQALVTDFIIAATDLPQRKEIVKRIQSKLGLTDPSESEQLTPEKVQQIVAEQVQAALQQFDAAMKERAAAVDEREVAVKEFDAETKRLAALKPEPVQGSKPTFLKKQAAA